MVSVPWTTADFSPDGKQLLTTVIWGPRIVWDVDPESWAQRACAIANRTLTQEEWDEFLPGPAVRAGVHRGLRLSSMAVAADPRIGTELAGYLIESVIGRGGMGVVYLAEHRRLKRKVALKVLAPERAGNERFRRRFLEESRILPPG